MEIQSLLRDLHQHGAEDYGRLLKSLPRDRLKDLFEAEVLRRQETPVGKGVVLGPQGRRALGLSPHYLSPPEVAATRIVRRRLRERLEADGYIYLGMQGQTLVIFHSP